VTRNELYQKVKDSVGDVDVIINYSPESGRTGTVKEGLKFLRRDSRGPPRILIVPVDRPGFSQSTVEFLMSKVSSTCPVFEGKGGHPLLVSKEDCDTILKASSDVPLNKVISPQRIPVDDRYLHLNIDTKEDVDRFLRAVEFL
jgi:CTP:molybdopterin cytidylyltransferase MocA